MATISWLADVLRSAGVSVVAEGDWVNRRVAGSFEPIGVLWHHTAARSSAANPAPALGTVINGRPELQGPLCHALVDYHGVFHLIAGGRANHAGAARASGPIPAGDGNTMLIGWEIDYAGDQPTGADQQMTAAQYEASVRATAAVLNRLGRDASYARGHRETSTTGKIDPSFVDLEAMRADVRWAMTSSPITNMVAYRASQRMFYVRSTTSDAVVGRVQFGNEGDIPLTGHIQHGRADNLIVYRPSIRTFFVRATDGNGTIGQVVWGNEDDIPLTGHFENTESDNLIVYRPSTQTFYVRRVDGSGELGRARLGNPGDIPLTGHFEPSAVEDNFVVYRPSNQTFYVRSTNGREVWPVTFGNEDDRPAIGHFEAGTRVDNLIVYRPGNQTWYVRRTDGEGILGQPRFGSPEDLPLTGHF